MLRQLLSAACAGRRTCAFSGRLTCSTDDNREEEKGKEVIGHDDRNQYWMKREYCRWWVGGCQWQTSARCRSSKQDQSSFQDKETREGRQGSGRKLPAPAHQAFRVVMDGRREKERKNRQSASHHQSIQLLRSWTVRGATS